MKSLLRTFPNGMEWRNFLRIIFGVKKTPQFFFLLFDACLRRATLRLSKGKTFNYPKKIQSLAARLDKPRQRGKLVHRIGVASGPTRLQLAKSFLTFSDLPDWETTFSDHEELMSFHRWNWLLSALTTERKKPSAAWGVNIMRSWLAKFSSVPGGEIGESYSVGERVANGILFMRATSGNWQKIPDDLLQSFEDMAFFLQRNLEYHSGELTGNHVLNNARAMFLLGHCTENDEFVKLAMAIFKEQMPKLFPEGVFLREGSSHYQFLIARWLLEMRLIAEEVSDINNKNTLDNFLIPILGGCEFFLVRDQNQSFEFPLIGDVSPDCEPAWLKHLPFSQIANSVRHSTVKAAQTGWNTLFLEKPDAYETETSLRKNRQPEWEAYVESGWYKFGGFGWIAIWHFENPSGEAIATHAHYDACSPVLFFNGEKVLIDLGRFDYTNSELSLKQSSVAGHNSLSLNGYAPLLRQGDRFLPSSYRSSSCNADFHACDNFASVKFSHDGFSRLGLGKIIHSREFVFSPTKVLIVDELTGGGMVEIEHFFHMPADDKKLCMKNTEPEYVELVRENEIVFSESLRTGWQTCSYGKKNLVKTKVFKSVGQLPMKFKFKIDKSSS